VSVLVTDGNQRSTLAVVRALGRSGVQVTVGETRLASLAGASKFCAKRVCYPSPTEEPEQFLSFLREELRRGPYKVLLPMTDITMQSVTSAQDSFMPLAHVPFPGQSQVTQVQDKDRKSTRLNSSHPSRTRMPSSA